MPTQSIIFEWEFYLFLSIAGCATLLILPAICSYLRVVACRQPLLIRRRIWFLATMLRALALLTTLVTTFATIVATQQLISPWLWRPPSGTSLLDSPLTARLFFFWLTVVVVSWGVFNSIGLKSIRDIHRKLKEIEDLAFATKKKSLPQGK